MKGSVGMQLCHMELENVRRKNNVITTRKWYHKVVLRNSGVIIMHVHPGLWYQRQKEVKP